MGSFDLDVNEYDLQHTEIAGKCMRHMHVCIFCMLKKLFKLVLLSADEIMQKQM
jgi:hypothetical protein